MAEMTGIMAALKAILPFPPHDWTIATDAKWALHRIEYGNRMQSSDQTHHSEVLENDAGTTSERHNGMDAIAWEGQNRRSGHLCLGDGHAAMPW